MISVILLHIRSILEWYDDLVVIVELPNTRPIHTYAEDWSEHNLIHTVNDRMKVHDSLTDNFQFNRW